MEELITKYGYAGIVTGTFFEGETILIAAGFLAHQGYLELPWVILAAFVGTLGGDQMYYYLRRSRGVEFLKKRPHWRAKSEKVHALLHRHQNLVILGFRFLYGVRTVTPFLIGTSKISPLRFLVLNAVGALAWAVTIGTAGYLLGHSFEILLAEAKRYELWALLLVGGVGGTAWLIWWWLHRGRLPTRQSESTR